MGIHSRGSGNNVSRRGFAQGLAFAKAARLASLGKEDLIKKIEELEKGREKGRARIEELEKARMKAAALLSVTLEIIFELRELHQKDVECAKSIGFCNDDFDTRLRWRIAGLLRDTPDEYIPVEWKKQLKQWKELGLI